MSRAHLDTWFLLCREYHHSVQVLSDHPGNIVDPAFVFLGSVRSVSYCLCSPIFFQSAMNGMSKSMSCQNIASLGEALSIVWWVEQMAHAASDRKMLMSLCFTGSAILISAVCNVHNNSMNTLQYSICL